MGSCTYTGRRGEKRERRERREEWGREERGEKREGRREEREATGGSSDIKRDREAIGTVSSVTEELFLSSSSLGSCRLG